MDLALTETKERGLKLNRFWVRSLGFSNKFSRIKLLSQLSPGERFFAALLRRDGAAAKDLISEHSTSLLLDQLFAIVQTEAFGSLIYERIVELDLAGRFDNTDQSSFLSRIREMARSGAVSHYQLNQKFAQVLQITRQYRNECLWFKGAHLSRAVYTPAYFRHFSDLDVIVHPSALEAFVTTLQSAGFHSVATPAHCNQIGVGPVKHPTDLITAPLPDWIPSALLTMVRPAGGLLIDIKVGPFERGVQALELERMFSQAEEGNCLGISYLAPCSRDHLMMLLCNFEKNRFRTWRTLFDIHLLVSSLDETPSLWDYFVDSCKTESIATTAWIGLSIAVDRLSTKVPHSVLTKLAPRETIFSSLLNCTMNPAFVWNSTSIPMLMLNAFGSADGKRKLHLLAQSLYPSETFLSNYYGNRNSAASGSYIRYLLMHWFVLLMPGGFVRRTLGKMWWSSEPEI